VVVGEIPEAVDMLIVGGGPGGYIAAIRAAQLGRAVVLVERGGHRGLGGACLQVGCIPSKALIEVAEAVHRIGSLAGAGVAPAAAIDLAQWQEWKSGMVSGLTTGVRTLLESAGVTIVSGELRFTRPTQAVIETDEGHARFVEFTDVIIATGSRPVTIAGLETDGDRVHDSTSALAMTTLPKRIVVIGGGYIGLELGTAYAKLGSSVTVVEAQDRLLPTMDGTFARALAPNLRNLGITVMTGSLADDFDGSSLRVRRSDEQQERIGADAVIVAVGRRPNIDDLGLERLGLVAGRSGLLEPDPDRRLARHVAAIGDITPGPALAHKASAEGVIAAEALSGHKVAFEPAAIPAVVFTDPEIASAGLTTSQATEAGIAATAVTFPLAASGRAATMGSRTPQGFLQLVAERDSRVVLGVHIVGPHASELIGEGVLAIEMAATVDDLAATIHPHPTLSELYPEAAHLWLERPLGVTSARRS
jgi:dihydrolipoamide dehydrogenase